MKSSTQNVTGGSTVLHFQSFLGPSEDGHEASVRITAIQGSSALCTSEKKVKLLMQAPPTDPRTMPAIRMKAQVPCGQQQKM